MPSQELLKEHILSLSKAVVLDVALQEWRFVGIYITEEFDHCPCGQAIKEHCEISNKVTHAHTFVGNVCINRFIELDTAKIFSGLKRILRDPKACANRALISYAESKGFLYEGEAKFLRQIAFAQRLSPAQRSWQKKIHRRIIQGIVVKKLPAAHPAHGV